MPTGPTPTPAWLAALAPRIPDLAGPFASLTQDRPLALRRDVRARAGAASAERLVQQHEVLADAYAAHLDTLPDAAFELPGGEGDWTVAQALGHAFDARAGLATAASLAAQGRFPADAPTVVPGVPGPADASREALRRRLDVTRRIIARAGRSIAGHETDPCPLDHPLVGRLRCGEWLLFAGVHDLMHLEQLDRLGRRPGRPGSGSDRP